MEQDKKPAGIVRGSLDDAFARTNPVKKKKDSNSGDTAKKKKASNSDDNPVRERDIDKELPHYTPEDIKRLIEEGRKKYSSKGDGGPGDDGPGGRP